MSMEFSDFYDIAEYASENWKGNFTPKEIACYAYDYYADFLWSKANNEISDVIDGLIKNLEEDLANMPDNEDVSEWLRCIKAELNI